MRRSIFVVLLALVVAFCTATTLWAGETGKLKGVVYDAQTGEPLPGANVIIEGTNLGAATDVDGFYVIVNIPPGTYTVKATMLSYAPMVVKNVKVYADQTTELNFRLKPEAIQAEAIVVTAREPIVKKDITSSVITTSKEEIKTLPVESVGDILTKKAGITVDASGSIHVRGGRSGEVLYIVDGIPIVDPYGLGTNIRVPTNLIKQMDLVAGTFNAEYGNAMSGVVNIVTDEGGRTLTGNTTVAFGDYLSTHDDIFVFVPSPIVDKIEEVDLSDTTLDPERVAEFQELSKKHFENPPHPFKSFDPFSLTDVRWSVSGPFPFLKGDKLNFFFGGRRYSREGAIYGRNLYLPTDSHYDTTLGLYLGHGDGEWVSMNPYSELSYSFKLTYKPTSSIKVFTSNFYSWRHSRVYIHSLRYEPLAEPHSINIGRQHILGVNYVFSPKTWASFRFSYSLHNIKQFVYEDEHSLGYLYPYFAYLLSRGEFYKGGISQYWYNRKTYTYIYKIDVSSQLTNVHLVKAGIEYTNHKIDFLEMTVNRPYEDPPVSDTTYYMNKFTHYPYEFAAYVQDKMEFKDIIINAGVRFDYFDPKWKVWVDDSAPSPMIWDTARGPFPGYRDADPKWQVSPRFGLAFPISESGVFHFSYGYFFQRPNLYYLYRNSEFEWATKANRTYLGNPDLKPQRTIAYEVGFKQGIGDKFGLEVIGYYKDIRDLVATKLMPTYVAGDHYTTYINKDYGNVRGISFFVKFRNIGRISGEIDYTYQIAEGTNSYPRDLFSDLRHGVEPPKKLVPLAWDERHKITGVLSYRVPQNFDITVTATYGSGLPYTPTDRNGNRIGDENSARKPSRFSMDLYATKYFKITKRITGSVFIKVYNLTDRLNELIVFTDTGRATYTNNVLEGHEPGYYQRPHYFSSPRQVRIGFSLNF
ncbi:MAG: hypothetical protein DRQ10_01525 [Candidatus Hydrothermota bacterium]|nr:MAG: hypothetical protein DRQ10_01525 [Candidatus Hydrothermae bacterium]